ncbi:MAG: hypothetical protein M1369_04045 [Deinococcus sp.]|nr:hypothetical protein [Deinococcus sp.]
MRTVRELRLAGLIAYLAALISGLVASGLVHLALSRAGRFGWEGFNFAGLVEGVIFLLMFTTTLWIAKRAVRVPATTLLSAGMIAPTSARRLAKAIPMVDMLETSEGRLAVLHENGVPVGVMGLEDHVVPWEEAPVVSGEVAASELTSLFWRHPVVFVADGNTVHGAIRRDAYFKYLGV